MRVSLLASSSLRLVRQALSLLALVLCHWPALVFAAEFGSEIEEQPLRNAALSGGIQTDYIVQVLLSLLLVVGVIVLLSFLLKKMNLQTRSGSGAVRVLSVTSIGAKDKLLLVAVGEEQLLLGSSPGNVRKLHTLEKPIELSTTHAANKEEGNFLSVLNSVRRGQPQ
ncbi:MAG: hypothetical protein DHS20C12_00280 [Pseudohongiella sp.]|nr:MAG: hypothetical protein DHS20C12_00280 [Pseudohongiella sp.]